MGSNYVGEGTYHMESHRVIAETIHALEKATQAEAGPPA